MVMAGGTGGHVFRISRRETVTATRLADPLVGHGTADRMEAELVPKHGIEIDLFRSKVTWSKGLCVCSKRFSNRERDFARAVIYWLISQMPYSAWAVMWSPRYCCGVTGIPVVLHEQNAIAGLTNQWLAKIARRVFQAVPGAFANAPVVGNPVRQDVVQLAAPEQRFAERTDDPNFSHGW